MTTRRTFLGSGAALGAAALFPARPAQGRAPLRDARGRPLEPGLPGQDYRPVAFPSGVTLPFELRAGVKVFHLVAGEHRHAFAPGLEAVCWGYNGQVNGPLIEAVEGDRVRIYVTNELPTATTVHWHGLILPNGMDGVSGLTQPPIPAGETWVYEFELVQDGTYMFHSHHDTMTQEGLGLTGMLVIHPREPWDPPVDRDFALLLHEWRIDAGAARPNPNEMSDFNVLTINGKVFPHLAPLVARTGQRVRIRFANLSAMDHHPMHLHGHEFHVTARDGQRLRREQWTKHVTTLVGVGETRDLEIDAVNAGDWAFHCHMTHHIMNQMGHDFPNMVGFRREGYDRRVRALVPGYMTMGVAGMSDMTDTRMELPENSIPMLRGPGPFGADISLGGMAGVLKVRDGISDEELAAGADPGWFEHPPGTVARPASAEELRRDGIDAGGTG